MEKKTRDRRFTVLFNLFIISFFVFIYFSDWINYWIYYKPFYMIFENSLYLPFYLHIGRMALALAMLLFVFGAVWEVHRSHVVVKLIVSIFTIAALYFGGGNIFKDIRFMGKEKYLTIECNVNSIRKNRHIRYYTYEICSLEKVAEKWIYIEMNFYQYNELRKYLAKNNKKNLVVYYLPNTEKMLKYKS